MIRGMHATKMHDCIIAVVVVWLTQELVLADREGSVAKSDREEDITLELIGCSSSPDLHICLTLLRAV